LCGYETWSLTLREEHRLRVRRGMFAPNGEEAPGEWRKLRNEEIHKLHYSPIIIMLIKLMRREVGRAARMGEKTNIYTFSGRKT
jgi:hypothetical protein